MCGDCTMYYCPLIFLKTFIFAVIKWHSWKVAHVVAHNALAVHNAAPSTRARCPRSEVLSIYSHTIVYPSTKYVCVKEWEQRGRKRRGCAQWFSLIFINLMLWIERKKMDERDRRRVRKLVRFSLYSYIKSYIII